METMKQAIVVLPDMAHLASTFDLLFSKYNWLSNSGTSSHIAMQCKMFKDFKYKKSIISGFRVLEKV